MTTLTQEKPLALDRIINRIGKAKKLGYYNTNAVVLSTDLPEVLVGLKELGYAVELMSPIFGNVTFTGRAKDITEQRLLIEWRG